MSARGSGGPLVTVIVPGFDVAPWARDAIDSLRAQTLADWVAVLVDDASVDGTGDLFDELAAEDARLRVVHHPARRGLGAARNTGLDLVDTPFVAFLDADDVMAPGALERLVGTLEATGSDFAVGAYVRLRPTGDGSGTYAVGDVQPWVAAATAPERRGTTITAHPEASGNIVAWSKVSRTAFWRRNGMRFPEGRLYEDQIVAQLMYAKARRFDVVPDVVVQWRERADGSSITQRTADVAVLRDYLGALDDGLAVLDAAGLTAAAEARVRLILAMDLPPLARIAATHPDDAYRRALGAFARRLWQRPTRPQLDAGTIAVVTTATLW
ncbi:hypothetical protein GCM10022200_08760 [Microbacterium awajiense]|uniref:Glycosyltransferase 2-like domain-containing protein n=1 Tax=Microbacterium awajiense TaxID=415214 RepID=A0ABP7ABL2_9MICO